MREHDTETDACPFSLAVVRRDGVLEGRGEYQQHAFFHGDHKLIGVSRRKLRDVRPDNRGLTAGTVETDGVGACRDLNVVDAASKKFD